MEDQIVGQFNTFKEFLDHFNIEDPRLRMIGNYFDQQSQSLASEKQAKKKHALSKLHNILQHLQELEEINQLLRERLEILAAALGACPNCWGEDASCLYCQGSGAPGQFLPDRELFQDMVIPAIRALSPSLKTGTIPPKQAGKREENQEQHRQHHAGKKKNEDHSKKPRRE